MNVVRARTLPTLEFASDLIKRAVAATYYLGTTPEDFFADIRRRIAADDLGVFIGFLEAAVPKAVAIALLPTSPMMMGAQVPLAYSEDHALSRAVGKRLRAWLIVRGHTHFYSMNLNDIDNRAYCRVWSHVGKSEVIGSIVETCFERSAL